MQFLRTATSCTSLILVCPYSHTDLELKAEMGIRWGWELGNSGRQFLLEETFRNFQIKTKHHIRPLTSADRHILTAVVRHSMQCLLILACIHPS
jgi:hypothetical protein